MAKNKISVPSGTRDFSPQQVKRRRFIFDTLQQYFEQYGFQPIETPAFERLNVLTGKYGEEGDQLIFKILNSGDFWSKVPQDTPRESTALLPHLSERALRYDLTVPFARYVVNHRNELQLPFKRYQIQPVWRADRPQKGRYREFWQCDVDVVGSDSLLFEAEFVQLYDRALTALGLQEFTIKLNHRQLLAAIAEKIEAPEAFQDICVAIDKLDKIGPEKVNRELRQHGLEDAQIVALAPVYELGGAFHHALGRLEEWLGDTIAGKKAITDLQQLAAYLQHLPLQTASLQLDPALARGLNYYTGCIFEVKAGGVEIGSIGGGGRYDNLAGIFGWEGLTGVGISFGADRIYDVLEALGKFDEQSAPVAQVLFVNFGGTGEEKALQIANELRKAGIACEVYPDPGKKLGKQFAYADKKGVPYVIVIGEEEAETGQLQLKHLASGQQETCSVEEVVERLNSSE